MLKELPYKRQGATVSLATPSGTAHITMNHDSEGQPFEVFVEIGKAGSSIKAMAESIGRLISLIFRLEPIPPKERAVAIVEQLSGIGGARSIGFGKDKVLSLPDAISKAMAEHYKLNDLKAANEEQEVKNLEHNTPMSNCATNHKTESFFSEANTADNQKKASYHTQRSISNADLCPICGQSSYIRQEGCTLCLACGHSEC